MWIKVGNPPHFELEPLLPRVPSPFPALKSQTSYINNCNSDVGILWKSHLNSAIGKSERNLSVSVASVLSSIFADELQRIFLCCTCWKIHISIFVFLCVKLCHCWNEALDFDTVGFKDGPYAWRMFFFQFNLFRSHCSESCVLNALFALVTTCKSNIKKVACLACLWDPQYRDISLVI